MSVLPDPRTQVRPAGALDDLRAFAIPRAHKQRHWEPSDGPLPALFVSHGAPPTLDDAEWLGYLYKWSQSLPKPRAVVMISAHWENAPVAISASEAGTPLYYEIGRASCREECRSRGGLENWKRQLGKSRAGERRERAAQ